MLQLVDKHLLLTHGRFDQVADGYDADDFLVVEDRQMPCALIRHECHALVNRSFRADAQDFAGHDFCD